MTESYRDAALYIRVSTDKQEELSPAAQQRLLLDYAKKNKLLIRTEHIFVENGISGRNAKKRPEFQRMIGLAKQKPSPFQVILVWKFSRFARNQEESIVYKSMLRKQCGIEVISTSEPLIEGPFGSLIERIIEWMDEYYSINLSGEVVRGMTQNALQGGYQCTPPLGYCAAGDGKPFLIVPEEARQVSYIFQQYVEHHMEPTAIARRLNEMGVHTKRGGMFEKRNVTYILRNSFYVGRLIWNGIETDGTHETFISQDLFDRAQESLNSSFRPKKRRSVSSCRHWLSGLVKCSICGASLSYNVCKYPFFNCWKYAKGMHPGNSGISEKNLVKGVLEYFEKILSGMELTFSYIEPAGSVLDENQELRSELERLSLREERIRLAYESGVDTLEEYRENKERLSKERTRLQDLLSAAEKKAAQEAPPESREEFLSRIRTVYDVLRDDSVDYTTKGVFLRSVVQEIVWDKDSQTLSFKLYHCK